MNVVNYAGKLDNINYFPASLINYLYNTRLFSGTLSNRECKICQNLLPAQQFKVFIQLKQETRWVIVFLDWISGAQVETITKLSLIVEHAHWASSPTGTNHVSEMTPELTLTSFNLNMSLLQNVTFVDDYNWRIYLYPYPYITRKRIVRKM